MAPSLEPPGFAALGDPTVRAVVLALNARDQKAWYELFSKPAFSDDGVTQDFQRWCDDELFGSHSGRILSIDKVEKGGLTFYARYRSDKWGEFQTFWKFVVKDGRITRLDVGATRY